MLFPVCCEFFSSLISENVKQVIEIPLISYNNGTLLKEARENRFINPNSKQK